MELNTFAVHFWKVLKAHEQVHSKLTACQTDRGINPLFTATGVTVEHRRHEGNNGDDSLHITLRNMTPLFLW